MSSGGGAEGLRPRLRKLWRSYAEAIAARPQTASRIETALLWLSRLSVGPPEVVELGAQGSRGAGVGGKGERGHQNRERVEVRWGNERGRARREEKRRLERRKEKRRGWAGRRGEKERKRQRERR